MKLVVLDGYTLNPGDLSWQSLNAVGDLTVHERTSPDQVAERIAGATMVFTNKTPLREEVLRRPSSSSLKYIGVLATGYNVIDTEVARQLGIVVCNAPNYGTDSVAQMTFALLLELCHHTQEHSEAVRNGEWTKSPDFSFWKHPLIELTGKTMGIIGYGTIGGKVAQIARSFGMTVLASTSKKPGSPPEFYEWMEPADLLVKSDVVSIHCPLTPKTQGLINKESLRTMKSSAFLINTSRGPIIDDAALAEALNAGIIAGAGLDVLSIEPPPPGNPLFKARNCIITPHMAWATTEARKRLMTIVVNNAEAFRRGTPINVVNK
jgi:glycerate dehydrogenase